jgi:DNA polymerase-3 subunit alpha/error-prone DNA polymerase
LDRISLMPAILSAISCFSLLRGVLSPRKICETARALGYDAVALTDTNNLHALPEFLNCCEKYGVRPIIAAQVSDAKASALLYADGAEGYANLCRIITERHCAQRFSLGASIAAGPAGLFAASADAGLLRQIREHLPCYFRITRPKRIPPDVKEAGISPIVIPRNAFVLEDDFDVHRLLRAIENNTTLSRLPADQLYAQDDRIASWDDVCRRFEVFNEGLRNAELLADRIRSRTVFGTPIFPEIAQRDEALARLRAEAEAGIINRYGGISPAARERLEYELGIIGSKGFASYFLIVQDIVRQSPRTCGRGSAAASLVSYALGITNVDPLRYNLMFERFLNPGRKDPPDIDVDFAWDERDAVIEYVFEKYGKTHAAMVSNHLTFGVRMAVRQVARVQGLTESEISTVCSKLPHYYERPEDLIEIGRVLATSPRAQGIEIDDTWRGILAMARNIIGLPCGIGTHCGGIVITPGLISREAPVQISAKGHPIIQWEKDGAEEMGLVKIDLLGNRSLAVIRDTVANVRANGIVFDEQSWDPASDPKTVELLARGKSMGVFYVESPAMRLLQEKTGAGDFDHLVIHSSIIRPAANAYINEYIRRLKGGAWKPLHPKVAGVLDETFGIMVYQEDVARVAMAVAGFDHVEADGLRKTLSKKARAEKLARYFGRFCEGARANNVSDDAISAIWDMMMSFSGYSFCKPHSASYVQVSMQSAWLKAHYPAEFMAGVLSNYGGFYTTEAYISEAWRLGLTIAPPDVNASGEKFAGASGVVRVGLCHIHGLSKKARRGILSARVREGPYRGLDDFLERAELDEADAERLIGCGACDTLSPALHRAQMFWKMRAFYQGQKESAAPELPPFTELELRRLEYRALGFLTSVHPITLAPRDPGRRCVKVRDLRAHIHGQVTVFGWCITSKTVPTKEGESMQFITFEDETGVVETVMFPEAYRQFARYVSWQAAFYISGRVFEEYGAVQLEVRNISPAKR